MFVSIRISHAPTRCCVGAPTARLRGATRRAFENLVQLAIDERIDFVVIAGDVFDGDWKDYSTGRFFRGQMVRLCEKGIPVYLIVGNHDAASVISKKLSLPENVHVFSTRATESKEVPKHPVPHRLIATQSRGWLTVYCLLLVIIGLR